MGGPCPNKTTSIQNHIPAARQHSRSGLCSYQNLSNQTTGHVHNRSRPTLATAAAVTHLQHKWDGIASANAPLSEHGRTPATAPSEPCASNTLAAQMAIMFQDLGDKFDDQCHAIDNMLSLRLEKYHADLVVEMRNLHANSFERQSRQQQASHQKLHQEQRQEQHQEQNQEQHILRLLAVAEADMQETPSVPEKPPADKTDKRHNGSIQSMQRNHSDGEGAKSRLSSFSLENIFSELKRKENEWISWRTGRVSIALDSKRRGSWRKDVPRHSPSKFASLVTNAWFNTFWHSLIVASAMLNGYHADVGMAAVLSDGVEPRWLNIAELTFSCLFLVELSIRIGVLRWEYFCGGDRYWNVFDALLIVSTTVADILDINDFARLLRGIRIIRLFHAIMGARILMPLRLMISCMVNCLSSLLWATLVVLLMMYFFAILFMQAAEGYVQKEEVPIQTLKALQQYYANLPTTMLSLFMAVTGGADWGDIREPIAAVHWSWGLCFLVYVFFVLFGVFNVLIGLFVDRAFDSSKMDKDLVFQAENDRTKTFLKDVKQMFMEMDSGESGQITRKQFIACQADQRMMSYMQMHQLNMIEPHFFFQMLDKDGSDSVNLEELIVGMMRFGGQARSSDVMTLNMLIRGLREEVKRFSLDTHDRLLHLETMTGMSTV